MSAFSRTLFVQLQWRFSRFAVMYFLGKSPCFGTFQAKKSKWLICRVPLLKFANWFKMPSWFFSELGSIISKHIHSKLLTRYDRLNRVTPIDQFAHLSPNISQNDAGRGPEVYRVLGFRWNHCSGVAGASYDLRFTKRSHPPYVRYVAAANPGEMYSKVISRFWIWLVLKGT